MKKSNKLFVICSIAALAFAIVFSGYSPKQQKQSTIPFAVEKDHTPKTRDLPYHQGMITIKVKEGVGEFNKQSGNVFFNIPSLDLIADKYEINLLEKRFKYNPQKLQKGMPDLSRIYRITFPVRFSVNDVVNEFSKNPNIEYAEPVPTHRVVEIPDDILWEQCQHLPQIFAPEAWEIHKGEEGTEEIIVGIVDTGVDWDHEDLQANMWQNMGEDADGDGQTMEYIMGEWVLDPDDINGTDDDINGFVDDLIGWNFISDGNDPNPFPSNPVWDHGTHCSGISNGVTSNGVGIASVSWNLSVMGICTDNNNTLPYGYDGIIYAAQNGADVISNSWSGTIYSLAEHEVINYVTALGSIVLASTGNHNSEELHYPAAYPGVLSIASVSVDDTKASYSAFGLSVDIAAPGGGWEGGILSSTPNNNYELFSGTSMSCPMAAGCFGLLKSYHPDWTNEQLITQMLGTADNIDSLNPDYQYMLGTGRVNALNMLVEENVSIPQELKIELTEADPQDENGNNINEPGEEVTLNFQFRNYVPYVGEDDVTVTLQSDDPEITILEGEATVNIPPDDYFTIEDEFLIQVSEDANSHLVDFTIHFETTKPMVMGPDLNFKLLVAPSGIFIFEGEENGQDYSGTYIKIFLEHLGYETTYSNTYPPTLRGFETVFLSHGNIGEAADKGTPFTEEYSLMFQEYLENGGNMFVDMGTMFGAIDYGGYSNAVEMKELFGVESNTLNFENNPIDSLYGMSGSVMEEIYFTQTNQAYTWYIDDLVPATGAIVPFYEHGYGNVSMMNDGSATYGHKTFYICYSLAELFDRNTVSSRYNILLKVLEFFEYELPEGYILSNFFSDINVGGSPLEVQFTDISLSDTGYLINSWQWDFDNDGTIDSWDQNPAWTFTNGGSYDVKLITSNGLNTDTLVLEDFININYGYLVYEGVADGNCYSGTFISEYLAEHAYTHTYRNSLPESLEGFSAVFLSFGNWGIEYTEFDDQKATTITDYLENGGYVYLEGGDALGFDQAGNTTLLNLLGIASVGDGTTNVIDSLAGQEDAITDGMLFSSSSQMSNVYIDIFNPHENGLDAFVESNYGTVAVQYTGDYDQRTFCFSYTLADLDDGEYPNTREELIHRICNFFDIYTDTKTSTEQLGNLNIFPNPSVNQTSISYTIHSVAKVTIEVYSINGQLISTLANEIQNKGKHQLTFETRGLPVGIYFCVIKTNEGIQTRKIIKL